ncbi:MAG: HD domain-containing protein [Microthrixaceae bacterium]
MSTAAERVPAASVDEVLELFDRFGQDRYDEQVAQLDHALQCAALARRDGAPDALVAAALLHDVGHLLHLRDGGRGPADEDLAHEDVGARWLSELFGPEVTDPIALHVEAKRYLCAVEPGLTDTLSAGSRASLVRQGGPLDAAGVAAFEALDGAADATALRRWDDAGKVVGLEVVPLGAYRPLLESVAG